MTIGTQNGVPTLRDEPGAFGPSVTPAEVRAMLRGGDEMALLDVREEGVFSEEGHPFFANSVPLSRLELLIRDLVPRPSTHIVVLDGGEEGLAERAAAKLGQMGYRHVAVMAGGSARLGGGRVRAVHRRQRAEQGLRRAGRAPLRHAAHRRRRTEAAARCRRGHPDRRQPADRANSAT